MSGLNPYATPQTADPFSLPRRRFRPALQEFVVVLFTVLFVCGVVVALAQVLSPALSAVLMPRFGWAGLWDCAYPLIFLIPWLKSRRVGQLRGAAFVCAAIGTIHAVALYAKGTVATVVNPFNDRLHSSWLLDVTPFYLAAACLLIAGWRAQAAEAAR